MPLLPLIPLPLNDSHGGPYVLRMELHPTSASIYVRRESDKATWVCKVRSLQEILSPMQQTQSLDLIAVVTCLYNGVAYDSSAPGEFPSPPLELRRRELAFTQLETSTDDGYRLTMRMAVRSASVAVAAPLEPSTEEVPHAVPVVAVADDDVIFGFSFTPISLSLERPPSSLMLAEQRVASMPILSTTFANSFLNWDGTGTDEKFVRAAKDGVAVMVETEMEITLHIVHPRTTPLLFVVAVASNALKPNHITTYQTSATDELQHTVAQYVTRVPPKTLMEALLLPGSCCAYEGSKVTLRAVRKNYFP